MAKEKTPNKKPMTASEMKVDISDYLDTQLVAACKHSMEAVYGQVLDEDERKYLGKIHGIVRFYEARGGISDKQRERLQEFLLRIGE